MTARGELRRPGWLTVAWLTVAWVAAAGCPSAGRGTHAAGQPPRPSRAPRAHPGPVRYEPPDAGAVRQATASAPAPARRPRIDPVAALADGYEHRFRRRARLRRMGAVRTSRASELHGGGATGRSLPPLLSSVMVVVQEAGSELRVVTDEVDARLLLWIQAGDVYDVIVRPTPLSPEGLAGAARGPGIRLLAGLPVDTAPAGDGRLVVHHRDPSVRFDGTVPSDVVGRVYTHRERAPAPPPDARVLPGAQVLSRPGGPALATFGSLVWGSNHAVRRLGAGAGGFVHIVYAGEGYELEGFVRLDHVVPGGGPERGRYGFGIGHGRGRPRGTVPVELPAGTCLLAPEDGTPVGVMTRDAHLVARPADLGYWTVWLRTRWGAVEVLADAEDDSDIADEAAGRPGGGGAGAGAGRGDAPPRRWRTCR